MADARRLLQAQDYPAALAVCDKFLAKYSAHLLFKDMRLRISERQQQDLSEYIAKVDREAAAEADLGVRVAAYQTALERYPNESHLARSTTTWQ